MEVQTRNYEVQRDSVMCSVAVQSLKRKWGVRLEYIGASYVLHVGVAFWAVRFVVLGVSLWFGKIFPKPVVLEETKIPMSKSRVAQDA